MKGGCAQITDDMMVIESNRFGYWYQFGSSVLLQRLRLLFFRMRSAKWQEINVAIVMQFERDKWQFLVTDHFTCRNKLLLDAVIAGVSNAFISIHLKVFFPSFEKYTAHQIRTVKLFIRHNLSKEMTVALSIVLPSSLCFWQEENKSVISSIMMVVPGLLGPGSGYPYHCYCCYYAANPVNASSGFNICNYPYLANVLTNTPCKELDSLWPLHQVSGVLRTTCQRRDRPAFIVIRQSRRMTEV